jgi:hypothetical protein
MVLLPNCESNHGSHTNKIIQARLPEGHAALHVVYGNPSPENMVGGFFLAWTFLKSETILIPVILHSVGYSIALAGQVAGWYFFKQT